MATSFKKVQRHHDLIKVTCREIGKRLLGYVETIQLILGVTDKKHYYVHFCDYLSLDQYNKQEKCKMNKILSEFYLFFY